jgi:rare lipoprotein A (peptidoglycan hydrolase)
VKKTARTTAAFVLASVTVLTGSVALAHGQSGGSATTPTAPAPPPAGTGGTTWTVVKKATWYGPGFWGNTTACGIVLEPTVIGTAHKGLPCGTQVAFNFQGRVVHAAVIDRGPYKKGYAWDLTKKAAKRVGFLQQGAGPITATVNPAS